MKKGVIIIGVLLVGIAAVAAVALYATGNGEEEEGVVAVLIFGDGETAAGIMVIPATDREEQPLTLDKWGVTVYDPCSFKMYYLKERYFDGTEIGYVVEGGIGDMLVAPQEAVEVRVSGEDEYRLVVQNQTYDSEEVGIYRVGQPSSRLFVVNKTAITEELTCTLLTSNKTVGITFEIPYFISEVNIIPSDYPRHPTEDRIDVSSMLTLGGVIGERYLSGTFPECGNGSFGLWSGDLSNSTVQGADRVAFGYNVTAPPLLNDSDTIIQVWRYVLEGVEKRGLTPHAHDDTVSPPNARTSGNYAVVIGWHSDYVPSKNTTDTLNPWGLSGFAPKVEKSRDFRSKNA